ncbi:MAG: hypothetical protein AB1576_00520 [Bacillota bacterium]
MLVLGCMGLAVVAGKIRERLTVPEPTGAAFKTAEAQASLGLAHPRLPFTVRPASSSRGERREGRSWGFL